VYIYSVYMVLLAWKPPNIRPYTVYIYGSGQNPMCVCSRPLRTDRTPVNVISFNNFNKLYDKIETSIDFDTSIFSYIWYWQLFLYHFQRQYTEQGLTFSQVLFHTLLNSHALLGRIGQSYYIQCIYKYIGRGIAKYTVYIYICGSGQPYTWVTGTSSMYEQYISNEL